LPTQKSVRFPIPIPCLVPKKRQQGTHYLLPRPSPKT
jgi:hypothetical protein